MSIFANYVNSLQGNNTKIFQNGIEFRLFNINKIFNWLASHSSKMYFSFSRFFSVFVNIFTHFSKLLRKKSSFYIFWRELVRIFCTDRISNILVCIFFRNA
jgi:hypothetical protein